MGGTVSFKGELPAEQATAMYWLNNALYNIAEDTANVPLIVVSVWSPPLAAYTNMEGVLVSKRQLLTALNPAPWVNMPVPPPPPPPPPDVPAPAPGVKAGVTTRALRVRDSPSLSSAVRAVLELNDVITVIDEPVPDDPPDDGITWVKIAEGTKDGVNLAGYYTAKNYLHFL